MEKEKLSQLQKNELTKISGGGFLEVAFVAYMNVFKYSSLTGALIVGVTMGYLKEKNAQ